MTHTHCTQSGQKYNSVHRDEVLPNATSGRRYACANWQQSDEDNASGNQKIQDSSTSSLHLLATIPSNQDTTRKTVLYQYPGRRRNTLDRTKHRRSWTDSRETYQNAARREYQLLLINPRQANHCITLKYFKEFTVPEIRTTWSNLKTSLQQQGIVGFAVIEVTTRRYFLPAGGHRYYPVNRVHYHILVESDLTKRRLRKIFNRSCLDAGLLKKDFEVQYEAIPDRKAFEHKCKYILKYDTFKEDAILFRPRNEIGKLDKICSIGKWFINADGTKANKDKMWKSIVAGWYAKPKQP